MTYADLFPLKKPVVAVIHLLPLPGSPGFEGNLQRVYDQALEEAEIFQKGGVDALVIENFRDIPFYPEKVPHETVAAMAGITREVVKRVQIPIGVNVLRNDADAALSIAATTGAHFIRVNVHNAAMLTDQGIVQGKAYETLRKRKNLGSHVLIAADVAVKHAVQLAHLPLDMETRDLTERSLADILIVSGSGTGQPTDLGHLEAVKNNTHLPVWIGSGTTPEGLSDLSKWADGFIVGSHFKSNGKAENPVEPKRVQEFMKIQKEMR
jgi:membrane complex biogenesis BtpA family protein